LSWELVETGEKRDGRGRRINSQERREELLQAYRESGLTRAEFARRERINYSTFVGWIVRSERHRRRRPKPMRFAEVRVGPVPPGGWAVGLEVRLADGTVVRGSVVAEVAALVRALRT